MKQGRPLKKETGHKVLLKRRPYIRTIGSLQQGRLLKNNSYWLAIMSFFQTQKVSEAKNDLKSQFIIKERGG